MIDVQPSSWLIIPILSCRNGETITLDGHSLSIPAVTAAARHHATVALSDAASIKERVRKSRKVVEDKVAGELSVYGVSTGFGGSGLLHLLLVPA